VFSCIGTFVCVYLRLYCYCLVYLCLVLYLVILYFDFNDYRAPLKISIQLLSGSPVKNLQFKEWHFNTFLVKIAGRNIINRIINHGSRDIAGVGVAQITRKPALSFPDDNKPVLFSKNKPKKAFRLTRNTF